MDYFGLFFATLKKRPVRKSIGASVFLVIKNPEFSMLENSG
jgi:hypothetical protein